MNKLELLAPLLELVAVASLAAVAFASWVRREHGRQVAGDVAQEETETSLTEG